MTDRTPKNQHYGLYESYLYDQRMLWAGEFQNDHQFHLAQKIEEMLYTNWDNPILSAVAHKMFDYATSELGMDMEVMKVPGMNRLGKFRDYEFIVPYGSGWLSSIKREPTTISIYGDRHAGKTVTSWTIAWELFNALKETERGVEIHVFGDVDSICDSIKEYASKKDVPSAIKQFGLAIFKHTDFKFPEPGQRYHIIIYNEVTEGNTSKRGMASDNLELALRSFRVRHEGTWMIFNIIRDKMVDVTLREAPVRIIHHCTLDNQKYIREGLQKPWEPFAERSSSFRTGEGLAIYSLLGHETGNDRVGTNAVEGVETKPPDWLLECIEDSKKIEAQHVNDIAFMKKDKDRVRKAPDDDVIHDQGFSIYRDKIREAQEVGRFPRVDPDKVYWALMDYKGNHVPIKKACSKNGISYQTISDLRDEGLIEY